MVNAIWVALIGIIFLIANYFLYGKYVENKIKPTNKKTPAHINKDKTDFYPANKFFLFGHHFASIAGAGPIIGPILAISYFGWFFVAIWIVLGTVFIGAVHDYLSLMISVRNKAKGISQITSKTLNKKSGKVFAIMIYLTLLLLVTVFSVSAADSIIAQPSLVIPIIAISFIAVFLGLAVYKFKKNVLISSLIALVLVFFFMWVGYKIPLALPFTLQFQKLFWITILLGYGAIASLLPVWVFLQPRDYLSSIQLILFLFLGFVSIFVVRPEMAVPMIIKGNLPMWPILFITVACGAISGFHSLVATGTTSKQLSKEKQGRFIGYGGMIAEGLLALLVLLFVSTLAWDSGPLNFLNSLDQGWIIAFGNGIGNIVGSIGIPFLGFAIASLIGVFMVNQFILTSLDTSTRLSRLVVASTFKKKIFQKKWFGVLITIIPAYILAVTNSYTNIWRLFGSANQLIAAIALITISAYFIEHKKHIRFLIIPTTFMVITTIAALIYSLFNKSGYLFTGSWLLATISIIFLILAVIISYEGFEIIKKYKKRI
ncbi:carbon starvation protein A [Candidatus Pacearchaeota archaeon]|nr:carbon starvation protein A [Candidatus Pacearchaeota archaeon]